MAVPKLRSIGQDDSEEEQKKPQQPSPRYLVQPSEDEPTQMTQTGANKFNVAPQEQESGMPQIHIHLAPTQMKSLPVYDDGGVPDTSNLTLQRPDSALEASMMSTPLAPASKQPVTQQDGGDIDPNSMPGQGAQTRMYPVSGLSNTAPIMDDGGVVSKVGSKVVVPDDDSAAGIAAKNQNIQEYENATAPKQETAVHHESTESDKINPSAKYGDKPGEKRIDVSSYLKPLGSPRMAPIYDDGGPVKNDPEDGHHQLAVLEEGERVLTPEQNAQYETEHGAPADFGGPILQQPNPPVRPTMDTEHPSTEQFTAGAHGDVAQPDGKGGVSPEPTQASAEQQPAMMSAASNKVPPVAPKMAPMGQPQDQPNPQDPNAAAQPVQPEHNSMATTASAQPLPNEREKLEGERAALKQKMVDAAEGKFNNGKFDHVAYGEAKMALADLNKAHPWGQPGNHEGFFGKLGHGLAQAGEIASDVVLGPAITERIPGTRENLNAQEAGGQQQVTQGLAGKASEAETSLKNAQATMAGRPKDPKQGIAFETFRMNHSAPGTPEYESAKQNLAEYQKQNQDLENAKLGGKREKLPEQIDAQTKKVLSLPEGSPERAQAEADLAFMQKQAQQGQKLTDRRREIIDHAKTMGLDPDDPTQYDKAMQDYESKKVASKAQGGLPVWKTKEAIQNGYATQRALLVQNSAKASEYGLKGAELQQKADAEHNNAIAQFQSIKNILATADDSTVAANVIPMLTTLGMISTEGKVRRLSPIEIQALSPAQGSMYRWAAAHADKLSAGQLPDGYKQEVGGLLDQMIKEQNDVWKTSTQSIDKNFGTHAQNTEVKNNPKGGTTVTPKKATPNSPPNVPAGVPAGATHIYKDDKGNVKGYALNGQYHALTTK
jgi:hypothetical protein